MTIFTAIRHASFWLMILFACDAAMPLVGGVSLLAPMTSASLSVAGYLVWLVAGDIRGSVEEGTE